MLRLTTLMFLSCGVAAVGLLLGCGSKTRSHTRHYGGVVRVRGELLGRSNRRTRFVATKEEGVLLLGALRLAPSLQKKVGDIGVAVVRVDYEDGYVDEICVGESMITGPGDAVWTTTPDVRAALDAISQRVSKEDPARE